MSDYVNECNNINNSVRLIRGNVPGIRKNVQITSPPKSLPRLNSQSRRQARLLSGNAGVRFSGRAALLRAAWSARFRFPVELATVSSGNRR